MDTVRAAGEHRYIWPGDLRAAVGISLDDIGVVCAVSHPVDGVPREVFVPVRVNSTSSVLRQPLEILVRADEDTRNPTLALYFIAPDGRRHAVQTQPLRRAYYPAGRPIGIRLPVLDREGLYEAEVGVALSTGGSATTTICLYYPGKAAAR
jgi:hypothetical protein